MARITFDELTKAEQRVMIAKDLIARLRTKRFTPNTLCYLNARGVATEEADARRALKGANCRGCQIGGLFLCALDRHNKLQLPDVQMSRRRGSVAFDDNAMRDYLTTWFSSDDLDVMEQFFEGWRDHGKEFRRLVRHRDRRMRMIAQNIVDGKGHFSATRLMKTARSL